MATEASPADYQSGLKQKIPVKFCRFCGEETSEGVMRCKGCSVSRADVDERMNEIIWEQGHISGDQFMELPDQILGPKIVKPHCIYCGAEMKLLLPVFAMTRTKFVWACPEKHSYILTDSIDGIRRRLDYS